MFSVSHRVKLADAWSWMLSVSYLCCIGSCASCPFDFAFPTLGFALGLRSVFESVCSLCCR